jgi:hypothetical protein
MKQIDSSSYKIVHSLIEASGMKGHLALVHAVSEGIQRGKVFVDDVTQPRAALVCNLSGFYFLFGEIDRASFECFAPELLSQHLSDEYTVMFVTSPVTRAALDPLFRQRISRTALLHLDRSRYPSNWRARLPQGFRIAPIDARTAQRIVNEDLGLDPWFIRIAGGPAAYAAHGHGLCLMTGATIASFCAECAVGGNEVELEVGTAPYFRNRGLAEIVCTAFIEDCLARDLTPAYSASSDNAPSLRLAQKLGYSQPEEIHGYVLEQQDQTK